MGYHDICLGAAQQMDYLCPDCEGGQEMAIPVGQHAVGREAQASRRFRAFLQAAGRDDASGAGLVARTAVSEGDEMNLVALCDEERCGTSALCFAIIRVCAYKNNVHGKPPALIRSRRYRAPARGRRWAEE